MGLKIRKLLNVLKDSIGDIKDKEIQIQYQYFLSEKNLKELKEDLERREL